MKNLFVYGTLMCEDIMQDVSGYRLPFIEGCLNGYSRLAVRREQYPAIFPDVKGLVVGIIYLNVPPLAFARLDAFEGHLYERRAVQVAFDFGSILPAETYVLRAEFYNALEAFDWNYDTFLARGKQIFRKHYAGYRRAEQAVPEKALK